MRQSFVITHDIIIIPGVNNAGYTHIIPIEKKLKTLRPPRHMRGRYAVGGEGPIVL